MVLTPMNQEAIDDEAVRERRSQSIPRKRAAEPWEIAKLALYLVSISSPKTPITLPGRASSSTAG